MKQSIEIKLLTDCEEHIPTLAKLWYEEISRHWVPDASIEKAKERLIVHLNTEKIPNSILYLLAFDPTIPMWYMRLGWQMIGEDILSGHRVTVMSISI